MEEMASNKHYLLNKFYVIPKNRPKLVSSKEGMDNAQVVSFESCP